MPAQNTSEKLISSKEYQIKAAFIYRFLFFIDWPQDSSETDSINIAVISSDKLENEIYSNLQGKEANGKKVCIELFTPDEYIKNLDKFKILYISGIPDNKLNKLITSINDKAILTISDNPDFLSSGGIIQFVNIDKNIRFQINLTKAEKSKLLISSRLLRIASFVKMD